MKSNQNKYLACTSLVVSCVFLSRRFSDHSPVLLIYIANLSKNIEHKSRIRFAKKYLKVYSHFSPFTPILLPTKFKCSIFNSCQVRSDELLRPKWKEKTRNFSDTNFRFHVKRCYTDTDGKHLNSVERMPNK